MKHLLYITTFLFFSAFAFGQNMQEHKICKGDTLEFTIGDFDSILSFQPENLAYEIKDKKIIVAPANSVNISITKQLNLLNSAYTIKVTVPELGDPELIITNQNIGNPICSGTNVFITIDPRTINNQTSFNWISNLDLGNTNGRFNQATLKDYNYFYIESTNNGCSTVDTTQLDFRPNIPALTQDSVVQCYGTSINLTLQNDIDYDFVKWQSLNNTLSCTFCESPKMINLNSDTLTVTTSYLGCEYKNNFSLPVSERLRYEFKDNTCPGELIKIKLTNSESFDTIRWENAISEECMEGINCTELSIYPNSDTTILITTVLSSINCINKINIPIAVKPGPQPAIFEALYPEKCSDKQYRVKFDNESDYDSWTWIEPSGLSCIDCEIFDVTNQTDSTFYIQLENQGCERNDSLVITVETKPSIDFSAEVCGSEMAYIDLGDKSLYQEINWSPKQSDCNNNLCNYWSGSIQSDTSSIVYRRTKNLCEYYDTLSIVNYDTDIKISLHNPDNETLYVGNTISLSLDYDSSLSAQNFIWYRNDEQVCSETDTCQLVLAGSSNLIKVENAFIDVCNSTPSASLQLDVSSPEISAARIPTVFTPDQSSNSVFRPLFDVPYNYSKFTIYNRWGKQVANVAEQDGWDGFIDGREAPSDIYRYTISIITSDDKIYTFNGEIMLLR